MAKVNICLKQSFITVTSLIGIIGVLLLALALLGHGELHRQVGMILSSLFLFVSEVNGLVKKPEFDKHLKETYLDNVPLTNTSESFEDYINGEQMELQCCGLDQGYMDWGYNIPESCVCIEESTNPCVAAPRDSILFEHRTNDRPIMIYKEPCLPYLIAKEMHFINIVLGVTLGITLLWVLSAVLSILILCRLNQKVDTLAVVYSGEA